MLQDCHETREAFEKAKKAVGGVQQLFHLDEAREIFLDTDASDYGIGACLYHRGHEGQYMRREEDRLHLSLTSPMI